MVTSDKTITIDEFEAFLAAHPDKSFELINGRIVEKVTTQEHGKIATNIAAEIRFYLKHQSTIKGHYAVEADFRLPDDDENQLRPDVSFQKTSDNVSTASAVTGMPHFAAEVKSPTNTYKELREKAQFYIENGTQLVWLVYPAKQIVEVYLAGGTSELYTIDDTLDGDDVLPGFSMTVKDIFDV
jgi:Uma2 family endonuclease